ncbi:MAG: hypothetical protein Q9160_006393 [Pyrenula sp. 1 TL-2023]
MHEILAPILWVVERDAIDTQSSKLGVNDQGREDDAEEILMFQALDSRYIEHDTFSLFCVVMQTAKSFYEIDESKDTSSIVARSHRIQDNILSALDPELAEHLHSIDVLPQIYLIRWIRLLFGREFPFDDVLEIWDMLFADNLNLAVINLTCVSMLLRIRWQLLEVDYSSALTLLLRYPSLEPPYGPQSLVRDAIFLSEHRTREAAASLTEKYTTKRPTLLPEQRVEHHQKDTSARSTGRERLHLSSTPHDDVSASPNRYGSRLSHQQKNLESLFQEVSGGLQRRTENWSLSRAVRGAVGEVRRNVGNINSASGSPRRIATASRETLVATAEPEETIESLTTRISALETRNKLLAKMLGGALESLRTQKEDERSEDTFNISLAKIQFVQVYLDDPEIPIPPETPEPEQESTRTKQESQPDQASESQQTDKDSAVLNSSSKPPDPKQKQIEGPKEKASVPSEPEAKSAKNLSIRPSLAQSSFSWMLGEDRHRSSFVSSVSIAPEEERRGSEIKPGSRPKHLFKDGKAEDGRKGSESEDDGFTLNRLRRGNDVS